MPQTTPQEWLFKLLPIIVLAGSMVAGWATTNSKLDNTIERLNEECSRSKELDKNQSESIRASELSLVEMRGDLKRIEDNLNRLMTEHRTATEAILGKLRENGH